MGMWNLKIRILVALVAIVALTIVCLQRASMREAHREDCVVKCYEKGRTKACVRTNIWGTEFEGCSCYYLVVRTASGAGWAIGRNR